MRRLLVLCALSWACGDDADVVHDDAGADSSEVCGSASDCDDGDFCNGDEICAPAEDDADNFGCVVGEPACDGQACDESTDTCVAECEDADGDGAGSEACGGDDCDDADPNAFPGNPEVCDSMGHDEDCDPTTLGPDEDSDSFVSTECCNLQTTGALQCGQDCDDSQSGINPGATDGCGGGDEDCDREIDEEPDSTWYRDQDSDNFGLPDDVVMACSQPSGYAPQTGDCNDNPFEDPNASQFNPSAVDVCDAADNDCDGAVDEDFQCDCMPPGATGQCGIDPMQHGVGPCQLGMQTCQSSGVWSECLGAIQPQTETCNMVDDDCDGTVDEDALLTCFDDPDGDGYAAVGAFSSQACTCPQGTTERDPTEDGADCREMDEFTYPGAPEFCDREDQDCSNGGGAEPAEDMDGDGHTAIGFDGCEGTFPKDDCRDDLAAVHPTQRAYLATGYCERTECFCQGVCVARSPQFACPRPDSCDPTGGRPASFDYNCDGNETPIRASRNSCPLCGLGFACPGVLLNYPAGTACGAQVEQIDCGVGGCSEGCDFNLPQPEPTTALRCR